MRHSPLMYGAGASSSDGFHDAVFTRKAGWGTHGGSAGGAPFDAADGPMGIMAPHPEGPVGHHVAHESTSSRVQRKPVGAMGHGEQMV